MHSLYFDHIHPPLFFNPLNPICSYTDGCGDTHCRMVYLVGVTPQKKTDSLTPGSHQLSSASARDGVWELLPVSFMFVYWPDAVLILCGQPQLP